LIKKPLHNTESLKTCQPHGILDSLGSWKSLWAWRSLSFSFSGHLR
jgi:hypothetical protein